MLGAADIVQTLGGCQRRPDVGLADVVQVLGAADVLQMLGAADVVQMLLLSSHGSGLQRLCVAL